VRSDDLTFVVLAKNEAAKIAGCLESIPAGSPTLVYDAESADATCEIARQHGAHVVVSPWHGFAAARTAAAGLVQTPWTFMLDADERLTTELAQEIACLTAPPELVGYSVPRRNVFCGRWIRGAGWWPDRLIRLFRTGRARIRARAGHGLTALHEDWLVEGATGELSAPLEHRSYASTAEYRRKFICYTSLEAADRRSSFPRVAASWIASAARFGWLYFARRGVFDGWQGLYVCAGSAAYQAVVETNAWRRSQ